MCLHGRLLSTKRYLLCIVIYISLPLHDGVDSHPELEYKNIPIVWSKIRVVQKFCKIEDSQGWIVRCMNSIQNVATFFAAVCDFRVHSELRIFYTWKPWATNCCPMPSHGLSLNLNRTRNVAISLIVGFPVLINKGKYKRWRKRW